MDVVILCGGQGAVVREEMEYRPKPMVELGGTPYVPSNEMQRSGSAPWRVW